jgi:hypothetical protein
MIFNAFITREILTSQGFYINFFFLNVLAFTILITQIKQNKKKNRKENSN